MAAKKVIRKTAVMPVQKKVVAKAGKNGLSKADGTGKTVAAGVKRADTAPVIPVPNRRPGLPAARECPLVLDGEVDAADFTPRNCLACDEFDCRFCATVQGSGSLRSRLFASDDVDRSADGDDGWGDDTDTDADDGGDADESDVEEGEDLL